MPCKINLGALQFHANLQGYFGVWVGKILKKSWSRNCIKK